MAEGFSNREIAERLGVTPEAMSTEIAGLFRAQGVISRVEIVLGDRAPIAPLTGADGPLTGRFVAGSDMLKGTA